MLTGVIWGRERLLAGLRPARALSVQEATQV